MSPPSPPHKTSLVSLLRHLHQTQQGGELVFDSERGTRRFLIQSGCFIDFNSNCQDDDLASRLLANGLLSQDEYDLLASRARQGCDTELLILDAEIIEPDALRLQREARLLQHLLEAGILPASGWSFQPLPAALRPAASLRLPLTLAILELARRYPDQDADSAAGLVAGEDRLLRLTAFGIALPKNIPLTPQESFVLSRLTSPMLLRQLLDMVPFSQSELQGILRALCSVDLVSLEPSGEKPGTPQNPASRTDEPAGPPAISARDTGREDLIETQRRRADALLEELREASPHQVLGVPSGAPPSEIKAAYHRLAKEFHPDRFFSESVSREVSQSVRAVFEKIRDAYESLKDGAVQGSSPGQTQGTGGLQREPSPEELEKIARASHNQGVHFYQQHDFFAAVQHFREAVRIQPAVARYHHSLARALMRNPRWRKEAEERFIKAIELDEFNADYRVSLGLLYLEAGMPRKAETQFRDALAWDGENEAARRELAKLQGDNPASSWFNKVLGRKKP